MAKAKQTVSIVAPSFERGARSVMGALSALDKASAKAAEAICGAFQGYIDGAVNVPKDEAGVKALGKAIRECPVFAEAVALGTIERKTVTEYAQSAMRAFYWGVPFAQSLKNDADMALPWGGAKAGDKTSKAGKVESTDRAALDATICKALKQARLLGLTGFASDMLELALETLEGFAEPADNK